MCPPICDKTVPPHLENPGSATAKFSLREDRKSSQFSIMNDIVNDKKGHSIVNDSFARKPDLKFKDLYWLHDKSKWVRMVKTLKFNTDYAHWPIT